MCRLPSTSIGPTAPQPADQEPDVDGMIQGGWGYVIAVYGISWGVLLGYAATLLLQSKDASLDPEPSSPPTTS